MDASNCNIHSCSRIYAFYQLKYQRQQAAMQLGAMDFYTKPYSFNTLKLIAGEEHSRSLSATAGQS